MTDPVAPAPEAPTPAPAETPQTNASPTPTTPTEPSADAKPPETPEAPKDEAPKDEAPKEPTPEEVAAAARAAVPEAADGYQVNLDDAAKASLGLTDKDPMVEALSKFAHESGKPQGWLDDVMEGAAALAKAGLFDGGFDAAAEATALGDNAAGRRREVEVFAQSLKDRGEIDDGEFGELMSLSPTANGVKLIEKMRKMMGDQGKIPAPGGEGKPVDAGEAAKEEARKMAADPRYEKDRAFKVEADKAWMKAFANG